MKKLTSEDVILIEKFLPAIVKHNEALLQALDELYTYKKIEEEIGRPLKVIVKALKDGVVTNDGIKRHCKLLYSDYEGWLIELPFNNINLKISDHKETWWLKADRSE